MKDIDKAGVEIIQWTAEEIKNGIFSSEHLAYSLLNALNKHDLAELKEHLEKDRTWREI